MNNKTRKVIGAGIVALLQAAFAPAARASNALYQIGYGVESTLMGGADVAVSRDAFAANNNPAGLTQIQAQALEIELIPFYSWGVDHSNAFGDYHKPSKNTPGAYGNGAYARHLENSPYAMGIALVLQGGLGWTYSGMNLSPILGGGRDDASSLFTIVKLAPAFAWKVNEQLSLGTTLGINYLAGTQELFPNTSGPAFQGFRFNGASGIGLNGKLGLQYRPVDDITIGVTYGTGVSIPLKGGYMRVNRTDIGAGVVRYDSAELEGLRLPEEFAVGIAFRPAASVLLSAQTKWYNWSQALKTTRLTASDPRSTNPLVPATFTLPGTLNAMNQTAVALGLAWDYDRENTVYVGWNYGRSILPNSNLSPLLALVYTTEYTFGLKHKLSDEWQATGGVECYPSKSATYDNPLFGPGASDRHNAVVLHISVDRRW